MREVGWVVFDEIHYMRDKERGVVWEETLILLPHNVHFVFLSATIPNARQFAEWVAYLHHQPCHVIYTEYRPTPLQHYLFPSGGQGIHMVVDESVSRISMPKWVWFYFLFVFRVLLKTKILIPPWRCYRMLGKLRKGIRKGVKVVLGTRICRRRIYLR